MAGVSSSYSVHPKTVCCRLNNCRSPTTFESVFRHQFVCQPSQTLQSSKTVQTKVCKSNGGQLAASLGILEWGGEQGHRNRAARVSIHSPLFRITKSTDSSPVTFGQLGCQLRWMIFFNMIEQYVCNCKSRPWAIEHPWVGGREPSTNLAAAQK